MLARCTFPPAGTPLTCGVSGGADSLALLALAVDAGCAVTAVHVDHGLRPGSAAEAATVAAAAAALGADFRSVRVEVAPGPDLEARARAARHAALGPSAALGHTADDLAETLLVNLLRGAGPAGLGALRPGPRHPLLALRRAETRALCAERDLRPFDDPSNDDARFVRNRLRAEVLPLLAEVAGRDPVPLLVRTAQLAAADADLLDELAAGLDPTDARALAAAPPPLAARAVRRWLAGTGAGPGGPERHPPDRAAVERVLAVAGGTTVACELAGGWRVARRGQVLHLEPPPPADSLSGGPSRSVRLSGGGALPGYVPGVPGEPVPPPWQAEPALGTLVVAEDELQAAVRGLGERISADHLARSDQPLLCVAVLKGAFLFMADLARAMTCPVEFDFMAVASYGAATKTSGVVRIVKDLDADLSGRHVLVVEDVVDSGLTLSWLRKNLWARQPASLEVCALLVKDGLQRQDPDLRYEGFRIPPDFVVGYGLDVAERYRNLPFICTYEPR